jgi:GNAT superfamily N-acetyltransferase
MSTDAPRDLGDGLLLRWSTAADTEKVAALVGKVFRGREDEGPNYGLMDTVRRYTRGDYPFMGSGGFVVVEDTRRDGNQIVACTCYLREEWEFDGIPIAVGRPEIVATDPAYRNKGLIRATFSAVHERAAKDATLMQGITGIRYFYRQFGYEYAIHLFGGRTLPVALIPEPRDGGEGRCHLRQAHRADIGFIEACYRHQQQDSLVTCRLTEEFWRYHIDAEYEKNALESHFRVRVIETAGGIPCGFLLSPYARHGDTFGPTMLCFRAGTNLHAVAPSLLRELKDVADRVPSMGDKPLRRIGLDLGADHPFYHVLSGDWVPRDDGPHAWYIRVPDLPAFIHTIAPVLERRLAASPLVGHHADVLFTFYRGGLRMRFEGGILRWVENAEFKTFDEQPNGGFPPLVFLQLLFGHKSLDELRSAYPDVWIAAEIRPLIEALFPKSHSRLFAVL